ncbi:IclR family transcriptional regulator [Pseudomonas sp. RIT-PI-AD]|uniref:IclR family transcriptional regulator n=1 Tax=Pseudomonas sp. RIT-PI-AD TaxID=3035294 RepID=UPI0021DA9997|nr:IclR family transcriptional regulator [Pseudomonas sp. RIT-PI-AD]
MANERDKDSSSRRQTVQAAEVGTDILKGLAERVPATTLSGLAEHVGMPASKVHRYLQALIASGFAEQDPATNHYTLGREALMVGLAALGRLDVVKLVAPRLCELRDRLNETCFLAVWGNKGPAVVLVEQAIRAVTLVTQVGSVLPLLNSSTGLVFNAFLPDSETEALRREEAGASDKQALLDLERISDRIRRSGLQQARGMLMPGVNALSAPVLTTGDRLAGVITVVGGASGFEADPDGEAAQVLLTTAREMSERMGGRFPANR